MFSCEYCEVFKKVLFKEHHRWMLLYFKFIGNLMTYITRETDDIYFQYNTLCLYHVFLHFFSLSVLLKLLKHVKLIVFENYNECKTNHLFLIKKEVTRFDKKIATWRKKSIDEEKNLLLRTLKKKTLSLRTQRRPYH